MRGGLVFLDRGAVRNRADGFAVDQTRKTVNFSANHWMIGRGGPLREEVLDPLEHLAGRSRRVYDSAKLGAVPHAMCEPARELLHFADSIGQIGSDNLLVVAGK